MQNNILFLGTQGSDAVFQGSGNAGGIVLMIDNYQILIDPGPGTLLKAYQYGIPLNQTNLILTSHNHLSHCNDLNAVIEAMTHSGLEKRGILIGDEATINGAGSETPYLTNKHRIYLEKSISVFPGDEVRFDEIRIKAAKTRHSAKQAVGFKIFTEKFVVTYTSDTSYFSELANEYDGTDILIANNVIPLGLKSDNNLTSEDTLRLISKVKPSLTILNHFGKKLSEEAPLYEARTMKKQVDEKCSIIAAREGTLIDPIGYSPELKQKTLMKYQKKF
jgi:ribonuclease BN (tRNA processing enzyme)